MKQITNKEYEEWQKYKAEKAKGVEQYDVLSFSKKLARRNQQYRTSNRSAL